MITPVLKQVNNKWYIEVNYITYGSKEFKNCYSIFIRYNYRDFFWSDIVCSRNQLINEINKIKQNMVKNIRLKPYRMGHLR